MKTKLVRIGNSRGIRLPKPIIEEAGISNAVEVRVRSGAIIIAKVSGPRAGWAEAAKHLREQGEDRLLDPPASTHFDREEWTG